MHLTGEAVAQACHGMWRDKIPEMIQGVGTDTRSFSENQAFLALRGPNFDGHQHAAQVAHQAVALIGDAKGLQHWTHLEIPQLEVKNTLQALGDIAAYHRRQLRQTKVLAITGSYGKTTVRSMLEHVLTGLGLEVAATQANLNNVIGVPQTLLAVQPTADVALIECGISEVGEMQRLSDIVQPDIALITGVSQAHAEGLGGLKGVVREKFKLCAHLLPQGWCVLGQGVAEQFAQVGCHLAHESLSMDDAGAVTWQLDGQRLTLCQAETACSFDLSLPAKHWAEDMALVCSTLLRLAADMGRPWSLQDMATILKTWKAVQGRMHVYQATAERPFTLIDDCYNANPASMQAALDTLAAMAGQTLAILGDMLELGESSAQHHAALKLHDVDEVWCIGEKMLALQAANPARLVRCFADVAACITWFAEQTDMPARQSTVLLKSSRSMGLDKLVKVLLERGQHAV